jgi:transglutaminase-like putative cysteine protease
VSVQLVPHTLSPVRRLVVVHTTGYRYDGTVVASYNEARMTPLTTTVQTALDARVEVDAVTWSMPYWDYWGTQVTAFEVLTPHTQLTVVSSSTVELYPIELPVADAGWDVLRRPDVLDAQHEFLVPTPATTPPEEVVALARDAAGDLPPDAAARAVCEYLHGQLEYVPGVTSVHTDAAEVWDTRKGVCQDFAHLAVGCLRSLGLAARYVSGYIETTPRAGRPKLQGADASHAWASVFVPGAGWIDFDPTNDQFADDRYIVAAVGRDYGDVPPLKGVILTDSRKSTMQVSVDVHRLD